MTTARQVSESRTRSTAAAPTRLGQRPTARALAASFGAARTSSLGPTQRRPDRNDVAARRARRPLGNRHLLLRDLRLSRVLLLRLQGVDDALGTRGARATRARREEGKV